MGENSTTANIFSITGLTPGLLQKKCNSPGEFPGLAVFLDVFVFRKFDKKSQNVTVRESLL